LADTVVHVPVVEVFAFDGPSAKFEGSAFARLRELVDAWKHQLAPAWNLHVRDVGQRIESLENDRKREEAKIEAELAPARAQAEATYETQTKNLKGADAEGRKAFEDFVAESNAALTTVWQKLTGLELARPHLNSAQELIDSTGSGTAMASGVTGGYPAARSSAEGLGAYGPVMSDPVIRKYLVWIALGSLLICSLVFKSFGFGLFATFWVVGGVLILRMYDRSRATETFQVFVRATRREQERRVRALDETAGGRGTERAKAEAARSSTMAALNAQQAERLAAVAASQAALRKALSAMWCASLERCAEVVQAFEIAIETASLSPNVQLTPGLNLDAGPPAELIDQLRLRYGSGHLPDLAKLSPEMAEVVGAPPGPGRSSLKVPAVWDLGDQPVLMMLAKGPTGAVDDRLSANLITRALAQLPPGKLHLTLFDPVGLGRNFAPFLKLGDFSDQLINKKVWTARDDLRRRLRELIEHIERVTQQYLRSDFADIAAYNARAGAIAESYRLLVAADFPEGFDEDTLRDLQRVIQNGPRCGVFALLLANTAAPPPYGVDLDQIAQHCVRLAREGEDVVSRTPEGPYGAREWLDVGPSADEIDSVIQTVGEGAKQALDVKVCYAELLKLARIGEDDWWSRKSVDGIEVPLGPSGANTPQILTLGKGLQHYALIAGRPGSGKSNLLHVFIATVARLYPPNEVQLYLIDFKKGVEFKGYAEARLPHARVIAVESEREFGLSVLQSLDDELKRRGEIFRKAGAGQLSEYRRKTGEVLPRLILIADEFQEFFSREDHINREAAVLFDRLVRQGRGFGIHLILGTQSLANAGLHKSIMDLMTVRIALQCSDADSRRILDESNGAARSLTRPGEAIYNSEAGAVEGNHKFQVAIFEDEDRVRELAAVVDTAARLEWKGPPPTVFEGHEPADLAGCAPLAMAVPAGPRGRLHLWLGEPVSLKDPISAPFSRQPGRNLLVLSRDEQEGVGVVLAAMCSIAAQTEPDACSFSIVDLTSADAEWADHPEEFEAAVPHDAKVLPKKKDINMLVPVLAAEVARRVEAEDYKSPMMVLVILGLHRARDMRESEDGVGGGSRFGGFGLDGTAGAAQDDPRAALKAILRDGPEVGVHTLIWSDSYASLEKVLDGASFAQLGIRVAGPLPRNESHRMFDDDTASDIDKPHRMMKSDEERVGVLELFRPYAVPPASFLQAFGRRLGARVVDKGVR
jgi:S-DNA-T family DNA segregation ATPase FtsK/SpoIIIE